MPHDSTLPVLPSPTEFQSLASEVRRDIQPRLKALEQVSEVLANDIDEMRRTLASKSDLGTLQASVVAKIDSAVNGLLREALASIPARQSAIWTAVTAVATIAAVVAALAFHTKF